MTFVVILIVIAITGVLVRLVTTLVQMDPPFKSAFIAIACLGLLIWILWYAGLMDGSFGTHRLWGGPPERGRLLR